MKRSLWPSALIILGLLAWHGGLHAWQVFAASACIAGLWLRSPEARSLPRWAVWGLAGLGLWQLLVSVDAQASLNALVWAACIATLALALAREGRPSGDAGLKAVFALSSSSALALFFSAHQVTLAHPGKIWTGTALVAEATHKFFPNQNLLAVGVLVPGVLLALAWIYQGRSRWLAWPGLLLLATALGYAGSRGGLVALAAAGAWFLLRAFTRQGLSLRLALCAVLLAFTLGLSWKLPGMGLQRRAAAEAAPQTADSFRYQRMKFWRASFLASAQRPWAGWGAATFAKVILRQDVGGELSERNPIARYRLRLEHAHNELLELAVEWGWPLAVLALVSVLAWFWWRWRQPEDDPQAWALEAFLAGLAMHAMIDMPLHPPFMLLSALLAVAWLGPVPTVSSAPAKGWPFAVVMALAVAFSAGAWLALGLRKADPGEPWAWKAVALMQPFDPSLAARKAELGQGDAMPWMVFLGREDLDWLIYMAPTRQAGDAKAALNWAKACVRLRPYDAPRWLMLARLADGTGDLALARESLDRALTLEPNFVAAWELRQQWALRAHDKAAAVASMEALKRIALLVVPEDQLSDPYSMGLLGRKTLLSTTH